MQACKNANRHLDVEDDVEEPDSRVVVRVTPRFHREPEHPSQHGQHDVENRARQREKEKGEGDGWDSYETI